MTCESRPISASAVPERHHRGHQRQQHREQGSEHDEQDDRRGEDADAGPAQRRLVRLFGDLAGDRDDQVRPRGRRRGAHERLRVRDRDDCDWTSYVTWAKPIVPSLLTCAAPAGSKGETTLETCGSAATSSASPRCPNGRPDP